MDYEKLSKGKLKKICDSALRDFLLRTTTSRGGKFYCPLKKNWYSPDKMDVAHYIDRGIYHLRWDLRNVHLISGSSNRFDAQVVVEGFKSLHHKEYAEYLDELGHLKYLEESSKNLQVISKSFIIEKIKEFKGE